MGSVIAAQSAAAVCAWVVCGVIADSATTTATTPRIASGIKANGQMRFLVMLFICLNLLVRLAASLALSRL